MAKLGPESSKDFKHLPFVDFELIFNKSFRPCCLLEVIINFCKFIPKVDYHESALRENWEVVSRNILWIFAHKDLNNKHYCLAKNLNLLFLKIG